MNFHVIRAIFKRNFISYFSNPTGYVFICVFVLLIALAAFWPNEFFSANLANLDQLIKYLPLIMLVFIPAITMSIWADERRQGTDELLLTIPAGDLDVVAGKYLAAVAIFSVALLFSAISNWLVFVLLLGTPDLGLYFSTYVGFWLVGLAMLAIGMAGSFLTSNLTVAFVLGVLLNAPLALASWAEVIVSPQWASGIRQWSVGDQLRDFGRGVISLSGLAYFLLVVVAAGYLCMVLIGRRHWVGSKMGNAMFWHYLVRGAALVLLALGVNVLISRAAPLNRLRQDCSSEGLNSLAPETRQLLRQLDSPYPVQIEAFISPSVPESYAEARSNLINTLREMDAAGGDKVRLQIYDTEPFNDSANYADKQYEIRGQEVAARYRGTTNREQIFLGVAFRCGLEKVVVPFVDKGVPVEYELVRSIATVGGKQRRKVGVLATDVRLFGGFNPQSMGSSRDELIIDELRKQYEVKEVRADGPITEKFDVLLAAQPSSLSPEQMPHFLDYVRAGHPVAIFEDPFPFLDANVPGTAAPKQPPGGANPFMGRQPPQPKGDIGPLWDLLGIDFRDREVVWQDYNPYPSFSTFPKEFVFAAQGAGNTEPFNPQSAITSKLNQVLFLFPGAVRRREAADLSFVPLVHTGNVTGTVRTDEIQQPSFFGQGGGLNPNRRQRPTNESYILACQVQGKGQAAAVPPAPKTEGGGDALGDDNPANPANPAAATPAAEAGTPLNVVLVADIDLLFSAFFDIRARGAEEDAPVNFQFDNVTFVLNILDVLSGDQNLVEIRKRRPVHQTLKEFEKRTEKAREEVNKDREDFVDKFNQQKDAEEKKFRDEIEKLQTRKDIDANELIRRVAIAQEAGQRRLQATTDRLQRERDENIRKSESEYAQDVRRQQSRVKFAAVFLPPILPLLMGLIVFFNRRAHEREGVAKSRLR